MGAYSSVIVNTAAGGNLRPIDPRSDLLAIADLVELCFKETLDADGYRYLRQMRNLARKNAFLTLAYNLAETAAQNPVRGYVWEQGGRIVGNASLMPVGGVGGGCYLIANVAVHPDFRNQGIGRALTGAALSQARKSGSRVWLQVREENVPAVHIYRSLGFRERARRTTWRSNPGMPTRPAGRYTVLPRMDAHWESQAQWLDRLYPAELRWHLAIDRVLFQPGLMGFFYRMLSLESIRQWSVLNNDTLEGVLSWRSDTSGHQNLWLAAPSQTNEEALAELLCAFRWQIGRSAQTTLNLECPSDLSVRALTGAGFYAQQTLIWMDLPPVQQL